ncbi:MULTISPECIES: RluA family pseudouridine synthase [unclassified Treponema]|uniref:pseudouridine synthase n=1 Tax=unclassified Treponema TaxID=2638727 RepID=UPI0020A23E89|nr:MULTISPECIES: RluA family pseudouridine synthase [unclassified Treponema]UTC68261.1 RluA family pseudouridine synthase [Treponema sp. OMZ 789]UTC70981.1 RluA family pseudouridine synthase [Treponema sp. OMZ 790]UTC73721.1 RluA family pseudouridine synthase [Treponema sp. OMZ 791]
MIKENKIFYIGEDDSGRRLDRVIRKFLENMPLSGIYSAIRRGKIKVNGKKKNGSYLTKKNDEISIDINLFTLTEGSDKNQINSLIPKPDVILKTDDLLFVNKRIGELVHGQNSLCDAVSKYFPPKEKSLSFKTGALHRLDKDTSGILAFSQSLKGAQNFSKALREGKIEKLYIGITEGRPSLTEFKSTIDQKECLCLIKILEFSKKENLSLVLFNLITGRKHQIRIQCAQFGTPLLNDKKYGSKQKKEISQDLPKKFGSVYFLHAYKLRFNEQFLDKLPNEITAPFPEYFKRAVQILFTVDLTKLKT